MPPYYEYTCSNDECSINQDSLESFEVFQRITEEPLKDCDHCKSKGTLKRLISKTSFKFVGGAPTPKTYM